MKNNKTQETPHWLYVAGICAILALAILVMPPLFFPADWGKTIISRTIITGLLFFFLFQSLKKNSLNIPEFKKNPIIWSLAALFVCSLAASIFSVDPYFSFFGNPFRSGGFINGTFAMLLALGAYTIVSERQWLFIWKFSVGTGIAICAIAWIQYLSLFQKFFFGVAGRPSSTLGNPILLAIYLLLLVFFAATLFIQEKKLPQKIAYGSATALFLSTILITGTRAAYLGLIFGFAYFLLLHPKKWRALKIGVAVLLAATIVTVIWANMQPLPGPLEKNRLAGQIQQRLSINAFLSDARFPAWAIGFKAFQEKPVLGWGPENYSVGFDKYYDSSVGSKESRWWDRAHNIYLEIATTAGLPALLAYLTLIGFAFWYLQKIVATKTRSDTERLWAHTVCTTLIAYAIANFFSFDSFSSYILFFLIIAYAMRLAFPSNEDIAISISIKKTGGILTGCLALVAIGFLWQYNLVPFYVNAKINSAESYINGKNCADGFKTMEDTLPIHSFLDSYIRLKYADFTKTCAEIYPQNKANYVQRGMELINEAIKIQPLYTRYWVYLGSGSNILAETESDEAKKNSLISQADYFLQQALILAPNHPEMRIELANKEILAKNYQKAQQYAKDCIATNPELGDCYWELALAQIYLGNTASARQNLEIGYQKGFSDSEINLGLLANAHEYIKDYRGLVEVYKKLINRDPSAAQYHASMAFFYKELGEYQNARKEAQRVLELSPDSRPNVEAFLKSLPR